jgi:tetratricopeptide (TPR) repeat protein
MSHADGPPNRILLGHLISNGDCLYATAIARQIKHDFPGCHLTWAVSSLCRQIIEENPYIDEIWEIPLARWSFELLQPCWSSFADEALRRYDQGLYDFVFFTQIYPGNPHHFEGTVRPGIFLGYPGKITVPIQPSLFLRNEEVERVKQFAELNHLGSFEQVVLFESSGKSGQTHITSEFALEAAERIAQEFGGRHAVILSSHQAVPRLQKGVIDGSTLTLREMAELTKYCTMLIGCSSGISCVATSSWAKPLPMIQMLTNRCAMFASLAHDYLHFGLPTSHVIEMFDADVERLIGCFAASLRDGWVKARTLFHQEPQIVFSYYLDFAKTILLDAYDYYGFCVSLRHTVNRYGWHPELEAALQQVAHRMLPKTAIDREDSPDGLLSRLAQPARVLSSASIGISGYQAPSIRPETCTLSLQRTKSEIGEILRTTGDYKDNRELSQIIDAVFDGNSKKRTDFLNDSNGKLNRIAQILAWMQNAEYSRARQELIEWKKTASSWDGQLEDILGDLHWMQGHHSEALACYQKALPNQSNRLSIQRKMDRLLIRNGTETAINESEAHLNNLGLIFYLPGPVSNFAMKALARARLKITRRASLETAFLTIREKGNKEWSLTDGEDLLCAAQDFVFQDSKAAPDSKAFLNAAVDWADRKGKKWVALARLDTVITPGFLRLLQSQLTLQPSALIVERRGVREERCFAPGLILVGSEWWKKNHYRFRGYQLRGIDWMALYAIKILRFAKAEYACGAEKQLLTTEPEVPLTGTRERLRRLVALLKGDFSDIIRWKLFNRCYDKREGNPDEGQTEALIRHFFHCDILKAVFARPPP